MDIMELGALGELVGGVAVIGSLIYVGLQVSQSNRMEMAESIRASTRDYVSIFLRMDPRLIRAACLRFETLDDDDRQAVHQQMYSVLTITQTEFHLTRRGLSGDDAFDTNTRAIATLLRTPGIRHWWDAAAPLFEASFRDHLRDVIAAQEGQVPTFDELLPWIRGAGADGAGGAAR